MTDQARRGRRRAATVLSAGLLLVPGLEAQSTAAAGKTTVAPRPVGYLKFTANFYKFSKALELAGVLNHVPVYRTEKGELFVVDPHTGNLNFLGDRNFSVSPMVKGGQPYGLPAIKWEYIKWERKLSLVGVDQEGRNIHENLKGERFYLGPNGDMVFVR